MTVSSTKMLLNLIMMTKIGQVLLYPTIILTIIVHTLGINIDLYI